LEFDLSGLGAIDAVESVRLALFPNAASFQGTARIDVSAYFGDGAISAGDFDVGETIAQSIVVTDLLPMVTDVTPFVTAAASAGQSHVGFVVQLHRLPSGEPPFVPFVPFATKEFPNARFHPTLLVTDSTVPLAGDANGDGHVNRADVAAFVASFADTVTGPALAADFDFDGAVSLSDLMALQRNFGFAPIAAAPARQASAANYVPEPNSAGLFASALAALLCYRLARRPACPACLVRRRHRL
jgi:hypothetical protein